MQKQTTSIYLWTKCKTLNKTKEKHSSNKEDVAQIQINKLSSRTKRKKLILLKYKKFLSYLAIERVKNKND